MHIALKAAVGDKSINDFYPTPPSIVDHMLAKAKLRDARTILEPSAGRGDIAAKVKERKTDRWGNHNGDLDVIEINPSLRHVLTGEGFRVVAEDFLAFNTLKKYDLIIMNPPFSEGDKHLLKAIAMQENYGGRIVSLLNAETLRNPYTNTRIALLRKLEELDAEVEYMEHAFSDNDALRKTDVEIAIVAIEVPAPEYQSDIMNDMKRDTRDYGVNAGHENITHADVFKRMVAEYNFEIKCGLKIIQEYEAMKPFIQCSLRKDGRSAPILKLEVDEDSDYVANTGNSFVAKVRYKYWEALFVSKEMVGLMTTNLRKEFMGRLNELKHVEFSMENIERVKRDIAMNMMKAIEETILALFDKLSHKHHWHEEMGKNIHYYDGWKTNKCYKINKRVIVPFVNAWGDFPRYPSYDPANWNIKEKLSDMEKVFNYLDHKRTSSDVGELIDILTQAKEAGVSTKIDTKYFLITFYKKGTMHLEFKDLDLLKKFNIFGSQRKHWLPPSYGKAQYADMDAESKAVIDEFEGRESYEMTMAEKDYFIMDQNSLLMLAGGQGETE